MGLGATLDLGLVWVGAEVGEELAALLVLLVVSFNTGPIFVDVGLADFLDLYCSSRALRETIYCGWGLGLGLGWEGFC